MKTMWEEGSFPTCRLLLMSIIISVGKTNASCSKSNPPLLNDITSRDPKFFSDYWTDGNGLLLNDNELNGGWYSAVFNGRQYLMTDSRDDISLSSCNTLYPYHLEDDHPPLDELNETAVTRKACSVNLEENCDAFINVKIRKCGKEIQYFLKPTLVYSAYCFGAGEVIYDIEVPPPNDVNLGIIRAVPELRFKEIPLETQQKFRVQYNPYLQFRCAFSNSSNYFYNVQWRIGGKTIISLGPSQNIDDLCLHEQMFIDFPLGYMVQCSVTVSAVKFGQKTKPEYSENFYAGVKIYNTTVYLNKGSHTQIAMSTTLPIGCSHVDKVYIACEDEIRIRDAADPQCFQETVNNIVKEAKTQSTDEFYKSKCTETIKTLYNGATWDPNELYHFTIVTSDINYDDVEEFTLKLKFSGDMKHKFWEDKALPDVRVFVRDTKHYQRKVCYSHGDPHIQTADGYYFPQQQEGTFILYYNKEYKIEVQETTQMCTPGSLAACTCAVSIRAGKDVFMINRCGQVNFLGFSQCDDGGILQVVRLNTQQYEVFTPIGTKIILSLSSTFINIDIKMAPKDEHNVLGLCGYFDGDKSNDLVHSDGKQSPSTSYKHQKEFVNSWRVPKDKIYTRRYKRSLDSWAKQNGLFCVCEKGKQGTSAEALCSSTQYLDCPMQNSITKTKCHVYSHRKKRSPAAHEKEMDRLFGLMQPVEYHIIKKRGTNETLISEDQARERCSTMLKGSLAFTSYSNMTTSEDPDVVIRQCIFDIMATNDLSFADAHVDSVNTIVKGLMDEMPTYVETNKKEIQVFLKNSCSRNCSNRGNCTEDGECVCSEYYHGAICDIDERIPPIVTDIEGGGVCDTGDGDDCRCFYLRGDNFLESLKCKILTSEISITGDKINITVETFEGGFEDVFTGVCCIPEENVFAIDMFVREHEVSVSSDGVHYGENNTMYIFDSTCQKLESLLTGRPSFTLKDGFCFIEHACIADKYFFLSDNNTCLSCKTSVSVTDWTEISLEICIPTTTTTTTTTMSSTQTSTDLTTINLEIGANKTLSLIDSSSINAENETESLMTLTSQENDENQGFTDAAPTSFVKFGNQFLTTMSETNLTDAEKQTYTATVSADTVDVEIQTDAAITSTTQTYHITSKNKSLKMGCKEKRLFRLKKRKRKLSIRQAKKEKRIQQMTERIKNLERYFQRGGGNREL